MHRWVTYEDAHDDLASLDASERLPLLLIEYGAGGLGLPIADLRRLFIYAWADGVNAPGDDRQTLRLLKWIAPVKDVESYLVGTLTIFRDADGPDDSIRWTLEEAVAREEAKNGIVSGEVASTDVLAHLMAGGKNHVLVDPDDVSQVRPA